MSEEDDDKVRRVIQHIFSPDWSHGLGQKIGQTIKEHTSDSFHESAKNAARKYVDTVNPAQARARQDEQIAAQNEKIETLKKFTQPRDEGEIDAPATRQPVQMQREFSNDSDKEAYLERIRQAQKNASK